MKIALVEDNVDHAEVTKIWLEENGHEVAVYNQGEDFLETLGDNELDLLILDWDLPSIQGDEILIKVREKYENPIPVLFVTAKSDEESIVRALKLGADDFMSKPVRFRELVARVDALHRRCVASKQSKVTEFPPFRFDTENRHVYKNDELVQTTQKEFELLFYLFQNQNRLVPRAEILETVWGKNAQLNTRTIDTHVSRIRKKFDFNNDPDWQINVVYQYGYRLEKKGQATSETKSA